MKEHAFGCRRGWVPGHGAPSSVMLFTVLAMVGAVPAGGCATTPDVTVPQASVPVATEMRSEDEPIATPIEEYVGRQVSRPLPRSNLFHAGDLGFDPTHLLFRDGATTGEIVVMTEEEILSKAASMARDAGWEGPFRGILVLRTGLPDEQQIAVDPMTLENLRAAALKVEDIDWVILSRVR